MYPELSGKVAVLSGAAGNLGRAVVRRLHDEQVKLALIDMAADRLQTVLAEFALSAEEAIVGGVDLTRQADVEAFLERVLQTFGRVDILVNIAGGFIYSGPVHEMNPEDLETMFNTNVKTALTLNRAVVKRMVAAQTPGRIINIGARAALSGPANMAAYSASKAAVLRLTESMAAELLEQRITVNAVLPSTIDTPQNRKAMPGADFSRWVAPESLADVIAFLVSDSARDISGAALPVYGRA
jgi:NAD(P)-dependent dehydrogenase (short-subunit alcohol dehydrogenase family)